MAQAIEYGEKLPVLDAMRFFYGKTENTNFAVRIELRMKDAVTIDHLQKAAEIAVARYPLFRMTALLEDEKYHLADTHKNPIVHTYNAERGTIGAAESNGHLVWIGADSHRIILDFFHGLTDVHGFSAFAQLLAQVYCDLSSNTPPERILQRIHNTLPEDPRECMDCLLFVDESRKYPASTEQKPVAFQLPDEKTDRPYESFVYYLTVDAPQYNAYMRKYGSSRSAMLAAFMSHVIEQCHEDRNAPVICAVAADARKVYSAQSSLRDCTATLTIAPNEAEQSLPLSERLKVYREKIMDGMNPEKLLAGAVQTKKNNARLEKRLSTLGEKRRFAERICSYCDQDFTFHISWPGEILSDPSLDSYIEDVHVVMSADPILIEVTQCQDRYHLCYTTKLVNDPYVKKLQALFLREGIPCSCEQQEHFLEPRVLL